MALPSYLLAASYQLLATSYYLFAYYILPTTYYIRQHCPDARFPHDIIALIALIVRAIVAFHICYCSCQSCAQKCPTTNGGLGFLPRFWRPLLSLHSFCMEDM